MPLAMIGEALALLGAGAYGLAGLAILRGQVTARGDNGVFLSVVVTAALSFLLWLAAGRVPLHALTGGGARPSLGFFALAGLASIVLGRMTMYRATAQLGAVRTSLLRRLTPVFAILFAYGLLGEVPGAATLLGGAVILGGVLIYLAPATGGARPLPLRPRGLVIGAASALFYALSYILRRLGLDGLPDAALGTCLGALTGCVWMLAAALWSGRGVRTLVLDLGPWHWLAAGALSLGQVLQFFALQSASVAAVSILGALEVVFTALLILLFQPSEPVARGRFLLAAALAMAGTAVLMLG